MTRRTDWKTPNRANLDRPVVDETPPEDRNNAPPLMGIVAISMVLFFWLCVATVWTVAECRGVYAERME